jgi:hypothetical protein
MGMTPEEFTVKMSGLIIEEEIGLSKRIFKTWQKLQGGQNEI